jgi:hypothetical protein
MGSTTTDRTTAAELVAAVEFTPATDRTAATEFVPAVEFTSATERAAATELVAAVEFTPATEVTESLTATESAVKVAAVIPIARPVIAATEAMEPRTRADENAANEIVGAVISVRRAGVWGISIVAIGAVGWTDVSGSGNVSRTDSNAHSKPNLSVGGGSCHAGEKYENP